MEVSLDDRYAARNRLVEALTRDLVGPRDPEEVLTDSPFTTYVTSVVYPRDAATPPPEAEVDEEDDAGETTFADPPVSLANTRYPSSLGLTFAVDTSLASGLTVIVECARYEPSSDESSSDEPVSWRRLPLRREIPIEVAGAAVGESEVEVEPGLGLYRRVREPDADGVAGVTLAVVNRRLAARGRRDADSYFQVGIEVAAGGVPAFVERRSPVLSVEDEDLESYALIYRDVRSFAVGHGVSVAWDQDRSVDAATAVRTSAVPAFELELADSNPLIPTDGLGMRFLGEGPKDEVLEGLRGLCTGYEAWIDGLEGRVADLEASLRTTARVHLGGCRTTTRRIRDGISAIEEDDDAWRAFRLMNQAMLAQRSRSDWIARGRPGSGPSSDDSHRWRPFQIAFILLNVRGVVDPRHEDRDMLDLLWFPTGGGKTEAYLGLIALTITLRRLRRGDAGAGVTVLMRYTLRLLTIQQFERAAGLICALEHLRRADPAGLGRTPISIGLWVGRAGTPATIADARTALDRLRTGAVVESGNPMQLKRCPWCGTPLTHKAYWMPKERDRLLISCRGEGCEFSNVLPVHVVDEDIYRARPSLVIATADKFATLAWIKQGHTLFAVDDETPPPELIVQDELHLISGPLGTLAGLYEAAVDILCTADGVRPKVVASTATIRRARRQAQALFARDMSQFPPPGLDADDSYFATTSPREEKAARLYLGAMAPGTSHSTLMIRTYAALMQAILGDPAPDEVKDAYWTLVGYFNSLRVLGGARIQVLDDVRDRIKVIAGDSDARDPARNVELTSRESSSAIPQHLLDLGKELAGGEALDYVLATNMISVGVDVDRLGLMVIMGQPQATAEYIQASSRVGRRHPGLVVTLYNASRSRDRSHYENFPTYHGSLYRQVESTSVTPFSPRARDRALHGVLLSLVRATVPALRDSSGARAIDQHMSSLQPFVEALAERAERIEPGAGQAVRDELHRMVERWRARNAEAPHLVYANPADPVNSLLAPADASEGVGIPTPSSLRDVDAESNLYLVDV